MKVNRRSFFGVAAAAPVAAKQAVASVLEYEKAGGGMHLASTGHYPYPETAGGIAKDCVPVTYWQDELREVLRHRARIKDAPPSLGHALDLAAVIQIDNRRATSPAVKALLIAEERAKREKARELSYIDERIAEIKEKLGPLAMIFEGDA